MAHAAPMQIQSSNVRVKAMGQPLATAGDQFMIAGCPNNPTPANPSASPCVQVSWLLTALRVKIGGQFAVLDSGASLCNGVPPTPAQVQLAQMRVKGM